MYVDLLDGSINLLSTEDYVKLFKCFLDICIQEREGKFPVCKVQTDVQKKIQSDRITQVSLTSNDLSKHEYLFV